MEKNQTYEEFLHALILWGDQMCKHQTQPKISLFALLQQATKNVELGVFSPFLYLVLSASMNQGEALLLAAAFYRGLKGKSLSPNIWKQFWILEENNFPEIELYCQSSPLIFERNWDSERSEIHLRIVPKVFLFLKGILLEPETIPCTDWYFQLGQPLPALGKNIHVYQNIEKCLQTVQGKKLVYLNGPKGVGRKLNYAYLAAKYHRNLIVIPYEALQTETQIRDIQTECFLHHVMLVVELPEVVPDLSNLCHWLREEETIFLLGIQPEVPDILSLKRQYLPFSISAQTVLEDKSLFDALTLAYPWEQDEDRRDFLYRYNFLPGRMRKILELAKSYSLSRGAWCIARTDLRRAILGVSSHSLDQYAKKIVCMYQMKDLILPQLPKQKLFHIINRVRNQKLVFEKWGFLEKSAYGNGVSMIFAGPPGTGKTMAAQVLAAELNMELYRVELPSVVDKYIGETEKKLNRIFTEAEKSMAILFFDEADVLFSKRTEIKESNDKYNNMEIAFLLQKMEEYEGVSILATNYLQNFDSAFRRRISDIIDFPLPDAALRRQMWQSMLPERLPISDEIDFSFLAEQFEISGSMIKNILIYASFLAAETPYPQVTMEHILKGLSHELEKSGKKLSRDEYGEYAHLF